MRWLWVVGPFLFLFVALFVWANEEEEERRIKRAFQRWLDVYLGDLRVGKTTRNRRVKRLPPQFKFLTEDVGGGARLADLVVVPKLAYFGARLASMTSGAHSFTVYCKLAKVAPSFTCRPVALVDEQQRGAGIAFPKDPDFGENFLVEGNDMKIVKWLNASVRETLLQCPEAWLRVEGRSMALSLYGRVDEEALDQLLATADAIFSERGAGGAPSLFGPENEPEPQTKRAGYRDGVDEPEETDTPPDSVEFAARAARLGAFAIDAGLYAIGIVATAAIIGVFHSWHPMVLFNNVEPVVSQPWQGGWTTKGVGAFIAAETYLVGLLLYQAFLMTHRGQTLGKMLVGLRVVGSGEKPVGFGRGVLLRSWSLALLPVVTAMALSRPLSARAFFATLVTSKPLMAAGVAVLLVILGHATARDGRAWFDRVAATQVVVSPRWKLPEILVGKADGGDAINAGNLRVLSRLLVAYIVVNWVAQQVFGTWWA